MRYILMIIVVVIRFQAYSQRQPEIFAKGVISTGDYESHPAFSPSGDTLYFVKSNPDVTKWTICVSYHTAEGWSAPEIAPFSGQYMDADPFFTADGKSLFFISNRPGKEGEPARQDMDIWKMNRTKSGWSAPKRLEGPVNSDKSEYYPTIAANGTLYFGSRRDGGKGNSDIYRSRLIDGHYQEPENLGEAINTEGSEYEPFIAPDEKFLIFMAARPDHLDNADIYISYNNNGKWSPAEKFPAPINSTATEFSPRITQDGKTFFFASARHTDLSPYSKVETTAEMKDRLHSAGNGLCDIYFVDVSALNIKKP